MHRERVGEERGSKEMDGCPLTDAGMKSGSSFCAPVTIQLVPFLSQAFSPLGYFSFHHHLLLDLSTSGNL
jgi:hypothetical protein